MLYVYIFQIAICALVIAKLRVEARIFMKNNVRVYNTFSREDHTVNNINDIMPDFGFLEGAELLFSLSCPNDAYLSREGKPHLWLLLCSSAEARGFFRMSHNQLNRECEHLQLPESHSALNDNNCQHYLVTNNASGFPQRDFTYTIHLQQDYFYSLLMLQCPDRALVNTTLPSYPMRCTSRVVAENPGGEQLSSDEVPLPLMYSVLCMSWAVLATALFFNAVLFCKYSNNLHRLVMSVPVIKVLHVLLAMLLWQHIANTGVESRDLTSLCDFVTCIKNALLIITVLIIAEGWGVVRHHFKYYTAKSFFLLFLTFTASMLFAYWLHVYFMALSACLVIFMLCKALKWSSLNVEHVRRCRRKMRRFIARHQLRYATATTTDNTIGGILGSRGGSGCATVDAQLRNKLALLRRYRMSCAALTVCACLALIMSTFLHQYRWLQRLFFEAPELAVYAAIAWLFRLRNFSRYAHMELVPPREDVMVIELPDTAEGLVDPHFLIAKPINFKVEKETQTPRRRWGRSL